LGKFWQRRFGASGRRFDRDVTPGREFFEGVIGAET
jgi:hypothetical protein